MNRLELAIKELQKSYATQLQTAQTEDALEAIRVKYLGRQGEITLLMAQLKDLSLEEKRVWGPVLNQVKQQATELFEKRQQELFQKRVQEQAEQKLFFDVTAYKSGQIHGSLHPYTPVIERIEDIFISMGFAVVEGPEVETESNNFDAMNIPADHPARDMWDTFWLNMPGMLMRTHTSTVQAHIMRQQKPPIAIIAPGRAYRHEATDASHDIMFMQLEGLFIDKTVSLSNLFATVRTFLQALFNKKDLNLRVRPGYFPFVEPGIEFDISCPFCTQGCSVCKKTGWLELGGAGLVHPNVLEFCGVNSNLYSGFAFGLGLTRFVMLMYGISDIRLLHSGRVDFLKQF